MVAKAIAAAVVPSLAIGVLYGDLSIRPLIVGLIFLAAWPLVEVWKRRIADAAVQQFIFRLNARRAEAGDALYLSNEHDVRARGAAQDR